MALLGIGEEVDESGDVVVDHEGKIGLGGGELAIGLGHHIGIDNEGHIAGDFGWRWLLLGSKTVALFQRIHLESVDGIHDVIELVLQCGVGFDVDSAGEHQIDGAVEFRPWPREGRLTVGGLAAGVGLLHLIDQRLDALLLLRLRLRRRSAGACCGAGAATAGASAWETGVAKLGVLEGRIPTARRPA